MGQTITGSVTGTVSDASGAALAAAKVTATNVDTGVETSTTTNADGVYVLRFLQIGHYKISIAAQRRWDIFVRLLSDLQLRETCGALLTGAVLLAA
jgi:hypothetical protein